MEGKGLLHPGPALADQITVREGILLSPAFPGSVQSIEYGYDRVCREPAEGRAVKPDRFQYIHIVLIVRSIADEFENKARGIEPLCSLDHCRPFHIHEIGDGRDFRPVVRRDDRPVLSGKGRLPEAGEHMGMVKTETLAEKKRPIVLDHPGDVTSFAHRKAALCGSCRAEVEDAPWSHDSTAIGCRDRRIRLAYAREHEDDALALEED